MAKSATAKKPTSKKTVKTAAKKTSASEAKSKKPADKKKPIDAVVQVDRRLSPEERRDDDAPVAVTAERRVKVARRRQIDPTTCERDYSQPEIEFMQAMDEYKRANGRMFPTCSEILEVIRSLGYCRPGEEFAAQNKVSDLDDLVASNAGTDSEFDDE